MKFRTLTVILLAFTSAGFAQEHMADTLRNGILEEDSKQNPVSAIRQYQAVMNEFAAARQTAATALFRMAECFRKQGDRRAAISAYQRVLRDFGDQPKLVAQSRNVLSNNYKVVAAAGSAANETDRQKFEKLMEQQEAQKAALAARLEDERLAHSEEYKQAAAARAHYRDTIKNQIDQVKQQQALAEDRYKAGVAPIDDVQKLKEKILQLERELAGFDAGIPPSNSR